MRVSEMMREGKRGDCEKREKEDIYIKKEVAMMR